MTAVLSRTLTAAMTLVVTVAASAQVQPPRDTPAAHQQAAAGTAVISGTVTMAGSAQPARKARVNLSGAELHGTRAAVTDDQGRFSFTALPPGRYTVTATKPGHVSVTYGQRQPGRPGTPIQLADGQKFQADLQMPRGSVITGTIVDENGEPAPQTAVRVMRVVNQNGRRTLQSSNGSSTDDRGIYRAFGLTPGDYVVCATPRNTMLGDVDRMQVELRALQSGFEAVARSDAEQARAIAERISALRDSIPDAPDEAAPGYAPVCYPGTASATTAAPVTLGIAEERTGIDVQLQLAPLSRVEGMVVNPTGAALREISVTLQDAQQTGFSMGNLSARADAEGRFRVTNVPPGQYRVTARATVAPPREVVGPGGGRGRGGAPPPAARVEPITLWAAADIAVDGRNLSNVMLSLQQGAAVSGQVTFEGATTPPDPSRVRVTMSPAAPSVFGGAISARADASGRFTIPSVPPGSYRLSAGGAGDWTVQSAAIGSQDALDFGVDIKGTEPIGGAVITLTDRQTELTGVVTDDKNRPASELTLVAFAADSRYWTGSSRRMQSTRPATDGSYRFRNLPPGEYRLAPVYDLPPGALGDPAFLQQLEAGALRVTLQQGERKRQEIRVGSQ